MLGNGIEPGDEFGRYRVVRRIGAGGMGVVYAARDTTLDREVALKVIAPHQADSAENRARFEREAAIMARIDSAHVVSVHDYGERDGSLYLVSQLVHGGDLDAHVRREGRLEPAVACTLLAQVCDGLAHAHAAGVTHRDVKPSNVLLRPHGRGLDAVLCDFGIASMPGLELTRTGAITGSLLYMAPERHRGEPTGVAGDVYSAGCLLWFALTGSAPYAGTEVEIALAHLEADLPQLPGRDEFARRINQVLRQSMAKDPADRYRSAQAMQVDLRAAAEVAPAVAALPEHTSIRRPITASTVSARRARLPWMALTATSVAAALVLGGLLATRGDRAVADLPLMPAQGTSSPRAAAPSSTVVQETIGPEATPDGKGRHGTPGTVPVAPPTEAGEEPGDPVTVTAPAPQPGGSGQQGQAESGGEPSPKPTRTDDPSPSPSPSPTPRSYAYTCWNGEQTDDLDTCGTPTGETGLRYVYAIPSYCADHPIEGQTDGVRLVFHCNTSYDGAGIHVAFHEWSSTVPRNRWANRFYPGDGFAWMVGGTDYGRAWRTRKPKAPKNLDWIGMNAYRRGPFDVQIRAETDAARRWAFQQMRYRSPSQWRGYPN